MNNNTLRIGTRKSRLAMVQTEIVREEILAHFPVFFSGKYALFSEYLISGYALQPDRPSGWFQPWYSLLT